MDTDLHHVLRACQMDDQFAWWSVVQRFQQRVFSLCYGILGQREDAEEACQDTFVRMFRSLGSWDPHRDFEPWLLAIAVNRCRTLLARRRRRAFLDAGRQLPADAVAIEDNPAQRLAAAELKEWLSAAISRLPALQRRALLMFHTEHATYAQIAERLGHPIGTVKTWVHRARQQLMQQLVRDRSAK